MIQRMFVTLDTKKTNYKNVGKINHGDDLILELTVLSDGDMISFNDPMVDLLVKKSDGKMIRQNSGIEHIKPNKFVIEVMKDCVTSPGLSTNQLIINDNGRISTCMFYYTILNSLEEDIIESISNVEVLEQLDEFTIQIKDKMENFDEELQNRMSELEDAIDDLEEFFGDTGADLLEAELSRNEAEQSRVQAESVRVQNESRRLQNDLDLANAEAERVRAENIRIQNEADRALIDSVMDQKESKREDSELERIQNESKRITDEVIRQQNENARQSNESIRMSNETDRKTQENRRATAETNRVNAETTRRNNENSRISNETERQKAMNEMKSLLEDAREFDGRVGIIEDEIEEINSSLENLESEVNELKELKEGNINIDLANYATKTELSLKVDKVTGKSLIPDSEIERLSTLKNYDDSNIRSQLNDIENEIDELKEGNIEIDLTNYVTKNELSTKADKTELHSHSNKSVLDGITSSKVTEWNNKSTFDGNYNSLTNKPTIPTKTSQLTNDNGYITQHQDLSNYPKTSELTLGVHTDGLIYLFKGGQPVGNGVAQTVQSGDIVGYVDSNNNIVLSGNLSSGTYNIKYEMEDGSLINVGQIVKEEGSSTPIWYTNLADPLSSDWLTDKRLSTNGSVKDGAGCTVTNYIPCKYGDTVRIKGLGLGTNLPTGTSPQIDSYDSDGVRLGYTFGISSDIVKIDGDTCTFTVNLSNTAKIRICGTTPTDVNNVIITVNEEIKGDSTNEPNVNYTNLFIPSLAILNQRVNSSFVLTEAVGKFVTNSIDVTDKTPFASSTKIYIKGATFSPDGNTKILTYKTSGTTYDDEYSGVNGGSIVTTDMGNGVICVDFASNPTLVSSFSNDVVRFVMVLQASTTIITASDIEDVVITINEPI